MVFGSNVEEPKEKSGLFKLNPPNDFLLELQSNNTMVRDFNQLKKKQIFHPYICITNSFNHKSYKSFKSML